MEGFAPFADLAREVLRNTVGASVLYRPSDRMPFTLTVLWSDPHTQTLEGFEGPVVSTTDPVAGVRWADLPMGLKLKKGDCLERQGVVYTVSEVQPDGQAGARLILRQPDPD